METIVTTTKEGHELSELYAELEARRQDANTHHKALLELMYSHEVDNSSSSALRSAKKLYCHAQDYVRDQERRFLNAMDDVIKARREAELMATIDKCLAESVVLTRDAKVAESLDTLRESLEHRRQITPKHCDS